MRLKKTQLKNKLLDFSQVLGGAKLYSSSRQNVWYSSLAVVYGTRESRYEVGETNKKTRLKVFLQKFALANHEVVIFFP